MSELSPWKKSLKEALNISDDFAEASDHPITCRCEICQDWWRTMWDDDDYYDCPFTREELFDDR